MHSEPSALHGFAYYLPQLFFACQEDFSVIFRIVRYTGHSIYERFRPSFGYFSRLTIKEGK